MEMRETIDKIERLYQSGRLDFDQEADLCDRMSELSSQLMCVYRLFSEAAEANVERAYSPESVIPEVLRRGA